MSVITGVFKTRAAAEQGVAELRSLGIDQGSINLLTPESTAAELAAVPRTDAEQPGISKGLGAVVGGVAGFAGGYGLAALALSGVGTVFAVGIVGGIVLGALGGAGGEAAGKSLDRAISQGLPTDEFFFYEDALKQGRSVVIVLTDPNLAEAARGALEKAGAETIDRAREKWWLGMRDVEKEHYDVGAAGGLQNPESWYRRGFEASLDPVNRGKSYQAGQLAHRIRYPDLYDEKAEAAFRSGYERGQAYLAAERTPQAAAKTV
jgi:hypothetical protein